jgi:lysine-N-methylase
VSAPFPFHPRLAEHALVRLHAVAGEEIVVIHDGRSGDLHRMGSHEWDLISSADGTRDLDGLLLAASRRDAYRRASEVRAVLDHLHAAGLLAEGVDYPDPTPPVVDRPLDVLPDYSLTCDATGGCCGVYGSIVFTPLEAARARSTLPLVRNGGEDPRRAFTPERGAGDEGSLAVALVDNRCAYLAEDGRCGLHVKGGASAKPAGCRIYPATFVDDGASIRVSVGVECGCVLASIGWPGGAPLVPEGARTRADLDRGARVVRLPDHLAVTADRSVSPAELAAWSRVVLAAGPPADAVHAFWSLAAAVEAEGLALEASLRALSSPPCPTVNDVLPWIQALADRAASRVGSAASWRSAADRSLLLSRAIAAASASIRDPGSLAAALAAAPADPAAEAFYLRAAIHGHHLAGKVPLALALRDRALRVLVARAMGAMDPAMVHPLAAVEAIFRGHGVEVYALEVGR